MAGELNRYAISRATARDKAAVTRCRDLVDALMGRFLQVRHCPMDTCFGHDVKFQVSIP